jgi:2-methylcitrate dehydratase PrpD
MLGPGLTDPETRRLAHAVELVEAPDLTAAFPGRFLARVRLTLADRRVLTSPETTFRGELDDPLTDAEMTAKYRWLAGTLLCETRASELEAVAWGIADAPTIEPLLALLVPPPDLLP